MRSQTFEILRGSFGLVLVPCDRRQVLDWLLDPPQHQIATRSALRWLAFPLAYVVCSLIRGGIVGWYPYPFLDVDVDAHGYENVLLGCVGLLVGFVVAAVTVVAVGNRRRPGAKAGPAR